MPAAAATTHPKHTVEISILNQKFVLKRGQASESYIQELAQFVNDKMADVAERTKSVASLNVAILAALNIADDFLKKQQECAKKQEELECVKAYVGKQVADVVRMIDDELRLH